MTRNGHFRQPAQRVYTKKANAVSHNSKNIYLQQNVQDSSLVQFLPLHQVSWNSVTQVLCNLIDSDTGRHMCHWKYLLCGKGTKTRKSHQSSKSNNQTQTASLSVDWVYSVAITWCKHGHGIMWGNPSLKIAFSGDIMLKGKRHPLIRCGQETQNNFFKRVFG